MRLDDDIQDQRLSLEITPLIDIVFILVLFFAVTTSFINPEELDRLKTSLYELTDIRQQLLAKIQAHSAHIDEQTRFIQELETDYRNLKSDHARLLDTTRAQRQDSGAQLQAADIKTEQLERAIAALRQEQDELQQKLADETARRRQLERQRQELETERNAQLNASADLSKTLADLENKYDILQAALDEKTRQHQKTELSLAALLEAKERLQQALDDQTARRQELELQRQKEDVRLAALVEQQVNLQQKLDAERDRRQQFEQHVRKQELTIAALEQNQVILKQKLADQISRGQEFEAKNKTIESELRAQMDKSGRLTTTIATLLDENERLQLQFREKTAQNQALDQQLVKARQAGQALSSDLVRFKAVEKDRETTEELLMAKIAQLEKQVAESRKREKSDNEWGKRLDQAQKDLDAGLKADLEQNQIGIYREQNRLIMQLPDQILFDSGSAEIKLRGLSVLRRVGEILKTDLSNMLIQIGGHTDNVPVGMGKGSAFPSNWELSAARAVNVVHFFEKSLGIDPKRMSAVGYSEHRPIAPNTTEEGRARNRRIEIVVLQP